MCKEDVRIGRQLAAKTTVTGVPVTITPLQLMGANPDRGRLVVAMSGFTTGNTASPIAIRSGGVTGPIIRTLSPGTPSAVMTVEEYGQLLTGELWATVGADNAYVINATELVWLAELKDL